MRKTYLPKYRLVSVSMRLPGLCLPTWSGRTKTREREREMFERRIWSSGPRRKREKKNKSKLNKQWKRLHGTRIQSDGDSRHRKTSVFLCSDRRRWPWWLFFNNNKNDARRGRGQYARSVAMTNASGNILFVDLEKLKRNCSMLVHMEALEWRQEAGGARKIYAKSLRCLRLHQWRVCSLLCRAGRLWKNGSLCFFLLLRFGRSLCFVHRLRRKELLSSSLSWRVFWWKRRIVLEKFNCLKSRSRETVVSIHSE